MFWQEIGVVVARFREVFRISFEAQQTDGE
jgi:hypothetical protein